MTAHHHDRHGQRAHGGVSRWLAGRTLRGRLVAGLLATLVLACAGIGAVTYAHLRAVLVSGVQQELSQASMRYAQCMHPPPGPPGRDSDRDHQPPRATPQLCAQQQAAGTFSAISLAAADGAAYRTVSQPFLASNYDYCKLTTTDRRALGGLPVNGAPQAVTLSAHGPYLMEATGSGGDVFVSGLPLAPVTSTLRQVAIAEAVIFASRCCSPGLIGTAWVRVSLRPLRRVAATARRVTELPLGSGEVALPERVPDANPATEVGPAGRGVQPDARPRGGGAGPPARPARRGCAGSPPTPAMSCARRWPPSAGTPSWPATIRARCRPDVAHALGRVESESARMSVLVDELLLLAQLDAGRPLAREPVDLTRLAIDVTSDAQAAAAGHRWRLQLPDEPVTVRGDEHRLHQVLANLLSNAARHTPAGTTRRLVGRYHDPRHRRNDGHALEALLRHHGGGGRAARGP